MHSLVLGLHIDAKGCKLWDVYLSLILDLHSRTLHEPWESLILGMSFVRDCNLAAVIKAFHAPTSSTS